MNDCEPQNRLPIGKVSFLVKGGYQNRNSFHSDGYGELKSISPSSSRHLRPL